jgi:putative tryptophan/tyrosine transport system substrate-binding protein
VPIVHLPRTFVLAAALACLVAGVLRASSPIASPILLVVYVGEAASPVDGAFGKFSRALVERLGPLRQKVELLHLAPRYGHVDDHRLAIEHAIRRAASVIVTPTVESAFAARRHGQDTPVVFATYMDPVINGLIDSLADPGWQATGISLEDGVDAKRLELLKDAFPNVRTVAMLVDDAYVIDLSKQELLEHAAALGLHIELVVANGQRDVELALARAKTFDAWYVPATYVDYMWNAEIAASLRRARRPTVFSMSAGVRMGGTLAYEHDTSFAWPALADRVARILFEGTLAKEIPIERPKKYVLWVRALDDQSGLAVQPSVVRRGDVVR